MSVVSARLEAKMQLNICSYLMIIVTGIAGYALTILWWRFADQH